MPDTEDGVEVVATRQQPGAGPSRAAAAAKGGARRSQQAGRRRALHERQEQQEQQQRQGVIDLTVIEDDDDDDVQITQVKNVKRQRAAGGPGGAQPAALPPLLLPAAQPAAQQPAPPESPKGYKCIICLERMDADMATTTCGHMFCYKCISAWVQKSGNCPQCRGKLTKTKIIRIYPPS